MICAISGETAKEPVISPKSGSIFEKKLIVDYISTSGKDPINDEPLTVEELVPVNVSSTSSIIPPKPATYNSIPYLLSTFQNEWDALALEVFTLRKQLHQAREELSTTLYHHDAAVRVAANAIRERDEAKEALQQLTVSIGKGEPIEVGNGHEPVMDIEEHIPGEKLLEAREELFQLHKFQKPTLSITSDQKITIELKENHIQPFKKSSSDIVIADIKKLALGSPTGAVAIYDFTNPGKDNVTKISRKGLVTALSFATLEDNLIPIIAYKTKVIIGDKTIAHVHKSDITQILTHPKLTNLFVLVSKDGTWSLNDTEEGPLFHSPAIDQLTVADIHVDGILFCVGSANGKIQVFDLTKGTVASELSTTYPLITKIKFALNGYWLLVSSKSADGPNNTLDIIDLRKGNIAHTIEYAYDIIDFVIDPSSSIIITLDSSKSLKLHRYIKKGKQWQDDVAEKTLEDSKAPLRSLSLLSTADDESFKEQSNISFVGISVNSAVSEFKLNYS